MKNNKIKTLALALFAMALWGSAFPVLKLTYKYFSIEASDYRSKIAIAGVRFLLSGIFVLIYMAIKNKKYFKYFKPNLKFIILIGLLTTTINYTLFYIGVGNTSGVKSSIFQSTSTFLSVILAAMFLDEKMTRNKIIAIILGFVGIIVTNISKGFDMKMHFNGEGFLLISGLCMAISLIMIKKHGADIPSQVLTSGQMISGSLLLLPFGLIANSSSLSLNIQGILLVVYSGILSALAFTIWYNLLKENPASEISMLRLFIPIFGTILSAILLKEALSIYTFLGLILVVLGVYFVNKRQ